ncbi:unnamed protein product [Ixodes pacificus]
MVVTVSRCVNKNRLKRRESKAPNVSSLSTCTSSTRLVLESLDESVDPCDDFYGYVCNKWMRQNPVPDDRPRCVL